MTNEKTQTSKFLGKWTITKPSQDGWNLYTTYETSDVEEVRAAGRRGWSVAPHLELVAPVQRSV